MGKLRDAVLKIAQSKGIGITSTRDGRIRNWDREFGNGKMTREDAIKTVKNEFRYNLSNDDYSEIEKLIK